MKLLVGQSWDIGFYSEHEEKPPEVLEQKVDTV